MNKRDIKELAKPQPITPLPPPMSVSFSAEDVRQIVEMAVESVAKRRSSGRAHAVLDAAWFRLYSSIIGGYAGYVVSCSDADKLVERLDRLAQVATAALNHAINLKKVAK